ncbi:tripartite tricarboxylate transporter substrate binding protein [Bradyrhizobium sp. LTSPM299]|uniref:Bug family tripartite tricarboxylate transporter substrate binding protein n=1 Tax=Bradyrhizobium sp. LTSPM299 TaxID=1619233 RepID=UPI0005C9E03E|nr:tripartite tricarboxylate transporter substrate binding protein [Bradyrhizobium sp. LTSPM299]
MSANRAIQTIAATVLLTASFSGQARAQSDAEGYPRRNVSITVPYQAGGTADLVTRKISEKLHQRLNRAVIVENRPGASGSIGSNFVYRAQPDGYTLLSSPPTPIIVNQFIQKSIAYEPEKLRSVALLAVAPLVLTVRADFPARNMKEFVSYVNANAERISYASNGIGAHVATLLLMRAAGITGPVHVPYNGAAPALLAVLSGDAQFFIDNMSSTLPFVREGKMRILAIGSKERSSSLPDVPTFEETGYKDLVLTTWFGLFAPPNTPTAVMEKLNQSVNEGLQDQDIVNQYAELGLQIERMTPNQMEAAVAAERAKWRAIIEEANISEN